MSKDQALKMQGTVEELLPNATFRVKINEVENIVFGFLSGRMRQNNIKVLAGDEVEIEFSTYDLTKGRITRRL